MEYDATKRTALTLTAQLSDANSPTVCPLCLADFGRFIAFKRDDHVLNLRADCPDLFDNCVGILTARRSADELGRLKSASSLHHRRCKRHRLVGKGAISFAVLLDSLSLILSTALHSGERRPIDRARTTHKTFGDRRSRWPARPEQIYPAGPQESVTALVELAELLVCGGPVAALANCVLMGRTAILPVVLSDAIRPRLIAIFFSMLLTKLAHWESDPRKIVVGFFEALVRGPGALAGDADYLEFIAGYELEMCVIIEHALSTAPADLRGLDILASCCNSAYNAVYPPGTDGPRPPRPENAQRICTAKSQAQNFPHFNYGMLMHALIIGSAASTRCASPACGIAQAQCDEPRKFQLCARCRLPRYCSKACQAHHWKKAVPPHKAVCPILVKFNACAFFERKLGLFDEQYAKTVPTLEEAEIDVLNAWMAATGKDIGLTRQLLPMQKIDIRKPPI